MGEGKRRFDICQGARSEISSESDVSRRWSGTVLFVDDEEAIIELMTELFACVGVKMVSQATAAGALRAFSANPHAFDVVITDYILPNASGIDLIKDLFQYRSDIPVIMCTGLFDPAVEKKARESGVTVFLRKPYTISQIMEAIENIFDKLGLNEDQEFASGTDLR